MKKLASSALPPIHILQQQGQAIFSWKGTCDKLKEIFQDTLIVTGTNDLSHSIYKFHNDGRENSRGMVSTVQRWWSCINVPISEKDRVQ